MVPGSNPGGPIFEVSDSLNMNYELAAYNRARDFNHYPPREVTAGGSAAGAAQAVGDCADEWCIG